MANYGTIPPSSPPSLDFISSVKQRSESALSSLRPWRQMIRLQAFSRPLSLGDAYLRIRANFTYFPINYLIVLLLIIFLSLFFYPASLLVFIAVISAWILLFFLRNQPLVICGRTFEESYVVVALSVFTILLVLVTDSAVNIVGSVVSGIVVVLAHGLLRRTDDLVLDEEAAAAGGWYAVGGESGSRISTES